MLLHCDLPVAEPIAHDELGDGTVLSRRATEAVTEQVRRDRNHPSIVLWSAMNELGLDRAGTRDSDVYEQFARTLYAAVTDAAPTRPVIENDWVEPAPDRVFGSPVLTAHWYGRLHADYLVALDDKARRWSDTGRPLFVTEFGDWGLPSMPALTEPPFWDTREIYAAGVAWSRWPGTVSRFITETQRYQGVSDRLQAEVFRRHDHIGGYCLTELTDVPHELNGLLDLQRRPKPAAVTEITRLNQPVLPILALESPVVTAGSVVRAPLFLANDGPALDGVEVQARFGGTAGPTDEALSAFHPGGLGGDEVTTWFTESVSVVGVGRLPGYRAGPVRTVAIIAPQVPGNHDLLLIVRRHGEVIAANRYPIHVVAERSAPYPVRVLGPDATAEVLRELDARPG